MKVRLIANPAAGRGRGARLLPAARAALAPLGADVCVTASPGDEARLAREALDDGCTTIAVLGGDGTWSNAGRALLRAGGGDACALALLAAGTGSDYAKTLGAPARDFAATAALVAAGTTWLVDAGRVDDEPFLNIAGFGFDAAVVEAMVGVRWPRGNALYAYAAVRELFGYRGFEAATDGGAPRPLLSLVVANARYFGGGFAIAPDARPDDGALDFLEIGPASPLRRLRIFAASASGAHVRLPEVDASRAAARLVAFDAPPLYEADGELRRAARREVEIACVPGAIRVVAPATRATAATPPAAACGSGASPRESAR
ncbi:MAG: diacylglycerol/lipid kinase family protein [Gemmatimonadaceae bacterium]